MSNYTRKMVTMCAAIIGLFCLSFPSYAEEDVDSLKEQIGILESEVAELQSRVEQLESGESGLLENDEELETTEELNIQDDVIGDEESTDEIEILEEYTYTSEYSSYVRHFMVVKNNTNDTVKVSSQSFAYNPEGDLISAADASINALGAGCTTVFYEAFETDEEIVSYDTTISASESYSTAVNQDLSYIETDISGGAIFQVTNNGNNAAEFVKGYTLFLLDGQLVDYDDTYFVGDNDEIQPGETISKQITSSKDYDTIEFYLDGRAYN